MTKKIDLTDIKFETVETADGKFQGRNNKFFNISSIGDTRSQALHRVKRMVEQRLAAEKQLSLPNLSANKKQGSKAKKFNKKLNKAEPLTVGQLASARPEVKEKPKMNLVALVADTSGSMAFLRPKLIELVNSNIDTLASAAKDFNIDTSVSVYEFGNGCRRLRPLTNSAELNKFSSSSTSELRCNDPCTALRDAIIKAQEDLRDFADFAGVAKTHDVSFLVLTITDGIDNASKFNTMELKNILAKRIAEDVWTFSVLVPPGATRVTTANGIPAGNIKEWEQSDKGIETATEQSNSALRNYYGSRSAGAKSSSTFFVDTAAIDAKKVKANLVDIRGKVKILTVVNSSPIAPFCESQGCKPYAPGSAFYQLTKREKVQDYKLFMLMDNKTGAIYGGADARSLLGLPAQGEIALAPGNLTDYTVFVQSTSTNRNLFSGNKVLYFVG